MKSPMRNAFISFSEMTGSIVQIETDIIRNGRPLVGRGFSSNGRYAQTGILLERMIPRILGAPAESLLDDAGTNFDPFKAWDIMMTNEKPGGHGERSVAVGVIDMALWDLVAKIEDLPLYRLIADRFNHGNFDSRVFTYAAGGYYYPDSGIPKLVEEMQKYLDSGYDTVKMKVGGASLSEDLKRIEAVLNVVGEGSRVAVDANGRFSLQQAVEFEKAIRPYNLKWYEEAGDPLDYQLQAELSRASRIPMATGENLFSHQDVRNLVRHAGLNPKADFLQMDPALAYGLVEYLRMLKVLNDNGWSPRRCIPHGGHNFALHLAAGLQLYGNESYPGVFQPFGGFGDELSPDNGFFSLPQQPGIGIETKANLLELYRDF